MNTSSLHIVVRKRDGMVYSGDVWAMSGCNAVGPFDILPQHAQFVTVIHDGITIHEKQAKKTIAFSRGILRVHENCVDVFIGV